jgi:monoamine oxidase
MWIQNAGNNLLNDYANKYKIITHPSTFEPKVYRENNQGPLSEEEYERYSKVLYDRGFYATQEDRQDKAWRRGDEPLQKSADIFLKTLGNDPLKQKMTKLLLRDNISMEYSGSLNELSLKYWDSDSWIGGEKSDDFFVLSGYSSLVQAYAKDEGVMENIILNSPVTTINYEASGTVQVLYRDTSGDSNQPVMSICAKKVIITVPLGVLQAGSIMFVPELPQSTSNAIDRLGMGKMNKIFMFWKSDDVFWPSPSSEIEVLGDLTDRDSNFVFYNSLSFQEDKPALFAFFKGPMVHRLEEEYARSDPVLYEQRIVDLAMESLHSMFGTEIPRPEKVVVTQWNVDEYTMGAYSFNKVGMKQHDREVLASPIGEKRLFFSGEATHSKYFATTTGAFLTGRAAAKNAIKTLKKNEELK